MAFSDIMFGVLGWILLTAGYLFTFGLNLVPCSRLMALWRAAQGVDHLPFMYFLSLLNFLTWVAYGYLPPQKNSVLFICVVGAVIQLVYIIWYICICDHPIGRFIVVFFLAVLLLFFGTAASIGVLIRGGPNSLDTPAKFTSVLMYLGPLSDTIAAYYTGDPARMSVPIILASLGNAVCWGEYGRVQGQNLVRVANEYGIVSPVVQISFYLWIRRNELSQIFWEEIPQFFMEEIPAFLARITALSKYVLLRRDDEEDDD